MDNRNAPNKTKFDELINKGSENQGSSKRLCYDDSTHLPNVSSEKNPKLNLFDPKKLQKLLGPILGNIIFLKLLQEHFFPNMSIEECANLLVKTKGIKEISSNLCAFYIKKNKNDAFDVEMFKKLMTTYIIFYLQRDSSKVIDAFFEAELIKPIIVGHSIVNEEYIFHSNLFKYKLVEDDDFIYFNMTALRNEIRIHIGKEAVSFEQLSDSSNPAVILGKGAYGVVFKVFGTDGKWYVVKIFLDEESAQHEWDALSRVKGKHECFQDVVLLETNCGGDFPNIIISNFQGDVVVSNLSAIHDIDFQQLLSMLFKLAEALGVLHREVGICHGDIKPQNLILSKDSHGKPIFVLIDFGIANRIGSIISNPQECYTWYYRCYELLLNGFLRVYNTEKWSFVDPIKMSSPMDIWALIITFLQIICKKSVDFLGFHSITEQAARRILFNASPVCMIMDELKPYLGTNRKITMKFVHEVYNVLLNKEGPEKFVELFRSVHIESTDEIYKEYLMKFNEKRFGNPMIRRIMNIFSNLYVREKSKIDHSGPLNEISELFIEILCYGGDLSLLGCLTMEHIEGWLSRLKKSHDALCCVDVSRVFFC
jgi:serine/threonine protein kinase